MVNKITDLLGALKILEKCETKCYVLSMTEFENVCESVYGPDVDIIVEYDGITVYPDGNSESKNEKELVKDLTMKLMIDIKSIHATNVDDNIYIITN